MPVKSARPDVPPHDMQHRAYFIDPATYDRQRVSLKAKGANHRLAFVTAAMVSDGLFVDIRPTVTAIPNFLEPGKPLCVLIDDTDGGGPNRYHLGTLTRLLAGMFSVMVDPTAEFNSAIYATACARTACDGLNTCLIETQPRAGAEWMRFVLRHAPRVANLDAVPMSVVRQELKTQ